MPGKGRQAPLPRQAEKDLQQPAGQAAGQGDVDQGSQGAAQPSERFDLGQGPVGTVQAVLGDMGRLGLEHQARHIDVCRTFQRAHLAIDAEVAHGADLIGRQGQRIRLGPQQEAHQVGLGSR